MALELLLELSNQTQLKRYNSPLLSKPDYLAVLLRFFIFTGSKRGQQIIIIIHTNWQKQ